MGKISSYTALTSPADGDQMLLVDVSDTSMASSGTDKAVKLSDLKQYMTAWGTGVQAMASPDTSGVTDAARFQAYANLFGKIKIGPGVFYITGSPSLNLPQEQVTGSISGGQGSSIEGSGPATLIYVVGNSTGIYAHRVDNYGGQIGLPAQKAMGVIRDLVLDGTFAGANAIAYDIGDGWGMRVDNCYAQNFTGTNAIGWNLINRTLFSEKHTFTACHAQNCTYPVIMDCISGNEQNSHEYCYYDFSLYVNATQNGVIYRNGAWQAGGGGLKIRGNFQSSNTASDVAGKAVLTLTGATGGGKPSHLLHVQLDIGVELGGSNTYSPSTIMMGSGANYLKDCTGIMAFQNGGWTAAVLNGGTFQFAGPVYGDTFLSSKNGYRKFTAATPANPANITAITNQVMAGLAVDATNPTTLVVPDSSSGAVLVNITGTASTGSAIVPFTLALRYGTTTPPTAGSAATGTQYGNAKSLEATATSGEGADWSFTGIVQVTPGSTLWVDIGAFTSNAADALSIKNVSCTMVPLQ